MTYTGSSIKVLDPIDHLRMNAAMYIGPTSTPNHLFQEVLSNSVDEHLNGHGDLIEVDLSDDCNIVTITDHARGIPVDKTEDGIPGVTAVFTRLFSGGKFDRGSDYAIAVGLHGVGLSAVGALSQSCVVGIKRNMQYYEETYSRGKVIAPLTSLGPLDARAKSKTGTSVKIQADPDIFDSTQFDAQLIQSKLYDLSFLVPSCRFKFTHGGKVYDYNSDGLHELLGGKILGHTKSGKRAEKISEVISIVGKNDKHSTDLAFCFTNSEYLHNYSYCNCLRNIDGGTHETAIKKIFFAVIQKYFAETDKFEYSLDDLQSGVWLAIHLRMAEKPEFSSQTKEKLISKNSYAIIQNCIEAPLIEWCKKNQETLKRVFTLAQNRYYSRQQSAKLNAAAAKIKVNFSGKLKRGSIEGLTDCREHAVEGSELFILEGNSAAGTAAGARDKIFQAILPLKGKVPNAYRQQTTTILGNAEFKLLLNALGCGFGKTCNPSLMRYSKVIILTDADSDGAHIASLLSSFFMVYLRPLIENGLVYVVDGPLYSAVKGKERIYAYTQSELEDKINGSGGWQVTRFKGWGEASAEVLKDIAMNPDTRKLKQLQLTDVSAVEVESIMGGDSDARKLLLSDSTH